jgi:ATP-dependent Clp protease ATP-binding subunit ClpC
VDSNAKQRWAFGAIARHESYKAMRDKILGESKRVFRPEFLNRLDDIIVFHQLKRNDLVKIVDLELAKVIERLRQGYQGAPGCERSGTYR